MKILEEKEVTYFPQKTNKFEQFKLAYMCTILWEKQSYFTIPAQITSINIFIVSYDFQVSWFRNHYNLKMWTFPKIEIHHISPGFFPPKNFRTVRNTASTIFRSAKLQNVDILNISIPPHSHIIQIWKFQKNSNPSKHIMHFL